MGAIGGLLGLSGGAGGSGFAGPSSAQITQGTNAGQIGSTYGQNQQALGGQQALLQALQGQNGIGNQSQVFNQLQGVANGTGPNPAQAMLAQSTGQNVANQAAMAAGQRGAAGNVGLMARQAAQTGAGIQQNAAGQAATMQANQSLNALGQMGGIAGSQVANQIGATGANTQANQAEQGQLLNALQGQNSNQVAMQGNINNANAGLANTQLQGGQGLIGGLINGAGAALGKLANGGMIQSYADGGSVGPQSSFGQFLNNVSSGSGPSIAAPTFGPNSGAAALQKGASSVMQGAMTKKGDAQTGASGVDSSGNVMMPNNSSAGPSNNYGAAPMQQPGIGSQFSQPQNASIGSPGSLGVPAPQMSNYMSGGAQQPSPISMPQNMYGGMAGGDQQVTNQDFHGLANGGRVPVLLSPGEVKLAPEAVDKVKKGADPLAVGGKVPGSPKYPGNDYRNDTYKSAEKPGTLIIPNKVLQSRNPHKEAYDFVNKYLAKRGKKP